MLDGPVELDESLSASAKFWGPYYVVHRSAENCGGALRRIAINGFALPGANSRPYFGSGTGVPVDLFAPVTK